MPWMQSIVVALLAAIVELALSRHGIFVPAFAVASLFELQRRGVPAWLCVFLPMASLYDWSLGRKWPLQVLVVVSPWLLLWLWTHLGLGLRRLELALLGLAFGFLSALPMLRAASMERWLLGGMTATALILSVSWVVERKCPGWHEQRVRILFSERSRR